MLKSAILKKSENIVETHFITPSFAREILVITSSAAQIRKEQSNYTLVYNKGCIFRCLKLCA